MVDEMSLRGSRIALNGSDILYSMQLPRIVTETLAFDLAQERCFDLLSKPTHDDSYQVLHSEAALYSLQTDRRDLSGCYTLLLEVDGGCNGRGLEEAVELSCLMKPD